MLFLWGFYSTPTPIIDRLGCIVAVLAGQPATGGYSEELMKAHDEMNRQARVHGLVMKTCKILRNCDYILCQIMLCLLLNLLVMSKSVQLADSGNTIPSPSQFVLTKNDVSSASCCNPPAPPPNLLVILEPTSPCSLVLASLVKVFNVLSLAVPRRTDERNGVEP